MQATPPSYAESYYPRFHFGWSELRAIRADGWKAIDAPKPELYNLRDDPSELRNLYASNQPLADRMIADAVRLDREMGGGEAVAVKQPDRETMERLLNRLTDEAAAWAESDTRKIGQMPCRRQPSPLGQRFDDAGAVTIPLVAAAPCPLPEPRRHAG